MPRAEQETAERFPTVEHLRAIADTAIHAANVIAKSVITDDLMSPIRSERDENRLAVNEVLDKLESLFYVEPPGLQREIEQHRAKLKYSPLLKGFPTRWRHEVAVPLQSLWRTVAGLLIYFFEREPSDLGTWTWQAGEFKRPAMQNVEHPPIPEARIEADGRVTRLNEGLPTAWLGRLRQHAQALREALPRLDERQTTDAAADDGASSTPAQLVGADADDQEIPNLKRCQWRAYYAAKYVEAVTGKEHCEAKEVWDWWRNNKFDPPGQDKTMVMSLTDYEVPDNFATFESHWTRANTAMKENRHSPRRDRKSRSVVKADEL